MVQFVPLAVKKLAWTEEYALEKILPIICRTQLSLIVEHQLDEPIEKERFIERNRYLFNPVRLTKQRIIAGIPSFNVEWNRRTSLGSKHAELFTIPERYESCEPEFLLLKTYPKLVESFYDEKLTKTKKQKTKPAKNSKRVKETAQKPITEFFSEAKTSVLSIKSKQSSSTKHPKVNRSDDNATSNTNYNLNPLPSVHNECTKTTSKYNVNKTPAIEKAKRELMRKVFEESPDQRNTAPMYRTPDPSEGKENIPLQSTPIQVSKKG